MSVVSNLYQQMSDGTELWKILAPYSKISLRKKRNLKKFKTNPWKYVSDTWYCIYLSAQIVKIVSRPLNYADIGRKLMMVDELPQGAYECKEKYRDSR